nr:hypothetical protein [uncultured bacterium]
MRARNCTLQQDQKPKSCCRMHTSALVARVLNPAALGLEFLTVPRAQLAGFDELLERVPVEPKRVRSLSQLMQRIAVLFHHFFGRPHLGIKVLLVGGKGQAFRPINEIEHISFLGLQFRKCFFRKNNAHRVADGSHFYFEHFGRSTKVITYVITQYRSA